MLVLDAIWHTLPDLLAESHFHSVVCGIGTLYTAMYFFHLIWLYAAAPNPEQYCIQCAKLESYYEKISPHCCVGFLFFCCASSLVLLPPSSCTPWRRLASSGVGWAPAQISWQAQHFLTQHLSQQHHSDNIPHTTSRTQHHSHNISHNNISHTTSLTQHPTHNVSHATSLTQHPTHNITHTTSHTQHHSHNISNTPAACQGVGCQGVGCTPWRHLASAGRRRRFRGRRSTLLLAKGSDVRPGPAQISWQAQHFAACQGVGCTPWGRLASSGVGWAPAQISWQAQHFAACQGVGCTPWRRLASSGVGWAPAQISWQAQHFTACQGVGCTPWRRLASAGHRRRFRGRRSTLLLALRGRMYALASSVWRRLGTGADFVAGAALCCLPRGRMYALASSGVGWAPAQISWQAQHFAACLKGSDVRPGVVWRRLGTGADFVAGAALCCLPRGRMYALASSGVGWAPAQISWQAQHFAACQGVGCTPWRRLASSGVGWAPAQISWQAQHFVNLHVQILRCRHSICGAGS